MVGAGSSIKNRAGEISELERKLRKKLGFIVSQMTGEKKERSDRRDREDRRDHSKRETRVEQTPEEK